MKENHEKIVKKYESTDNKPDEQNYIASNFFSKILLMNAHKVQYFAQNRNGMSKVKNPLSFFLIWKKRIVLIVQLRKY